MKFCHLIINCGVLESIHYNLDSSKNEIYIVKSAVMRDPLRGFSQIYRMQTLLFWRIAYKGTQYFICYCSIIGLDFIQILFMAMMATKL